MMIDNIKQILELYESQFAEDMTLGAKLRDLINSGAAVTSRKEFRGHVTTSAMVVEPFQQKVLMIHHRNLDTWLLPGGHLEPEDSSLQSASLRELNEETGITSDSITFAKGVFADCPIHLDCHLIPANQKRSEPAHEHWDFRFLFFSSCSIIHHQIEETHASAWSSPNLIQTALLKRVEKLNILRNGD